ncbi:sensor domain-containing diguanylate cyclase [Pantoea sp. FN060301]|uniref:sensor domain-containing diguanylate cyclase n=1 Tax=Pantoea sp. FN060301 TaxID=3420380 RepID=UPI003D176F71
MRTPLGRSMAAFLLLTTLTVMGINVWSLWNSWQQRLSEREDDARNLSVSLAKQAEDAFLQVDITLADSVRQIAQNGFSYAVTTAFTRQLKEQHARLPQLHGLFIYDAQGNWVATSGNYMPAKASNGDRQYFAWHRTHTDTGVLVSHVIRSRSTGDLVIPVSMRLNDRAGNFAGVALATVKVDYFRHFYSYYTLGERDVLGLILADSTVLYIRPLPENAINRSLSASPLFKTALKSSPSGSATWHSELDGIERIYGYARLEQYPLIVAAGYDREKIWEDWFADNITYVVLNLILLAMITGMGIFVLRQVRFNLKNQLQLTQARDELTTMNEMLQSMALLDGLTGLANRRQFDVLLDQGMERSLKSGEPLSLIMIDIDFFKRYNEAYGHIAGDRCLKKIAAMLKGLMQRSPDVVARYGGGEFAIILPFTSAPDAKKLAERAVQAVRDAGIAHKATELPAGVVTISAGCCSIIASGQPGEAERLKARADGALSEAKRSGGNRVHYG